MLRTVSYLPTRYDRIDEYHRLTQDVSKEDFILFLKPIIGKCKSFKDFNPTDHQIDKIANRRADDLCDIVGGFFGKLGLYRQSFYNDWLPEDLRPCLIKDKNLCERRFNWVLNELDKILRE